MGLHHVDVDIAIFREWTLRTYCEAIFSAGFKSGVCHGEVRTCALSTLSCYFHFPKIYIQIYIARNYAFVSKLHLISNPYQKEDATCCE